MYFFAPNVHIPRPDHRLSKKINRHCTSRMYVNENQDQQVTVTYIATHSGHKLGPENHSVKYETTMDKPQKHFHCPFSSQCSPFCTVKELQAHSHTEHDSDLGKGDLKSKQQCITLLVP